MNRVEARLIASIQAANEQPELLQRCLWEAARKGYASAVSAAMDAGADPNQTLHHSLPLEEAADADHVAVVEALIQRGADANGGHVMARAAVESLHLLVAAGGRVDGNPGGRNPLLCAISGRSKQDRAMALLALGANVNAKDKNGATPLMLAAKYGRYETFMALLKRGAEPMTVDFAGRSALRYAAQAMAGGTTTPDSQIPKVRRIFRELKRLLPAQPEDMVLAAIASGNAAELREQLDHGLDPNARISGSINWLGLDLPSLMRSSGTLATLFAVPLDGRSKDDQVVGCTLLMWAIALRQEECVRALLDAGADVNAVMGTGVSAADISLQSTARIRKMVGCVR